MNYFEDIAVGTVRQSEQGYTLTRENIFDFCQQWDPMPFHIDEEAAQKSPMGKLFTSAAHLLSIGLRLGHSMQQEATAVVAGLGWDEVRFHRPGFVDDTIYLRGTITDKRVSSSNPSRGIVTTLMELLNQDGELVSSYKVSTMVLCRDA